MTAPVVLVANVDFPHYGNVGQQVIFDTIPKFTYLNNNKIKFI